MNASVNTSPAENSLSALLTLVTTIINIQSPAVSQIKDGDHYDFIIVGAGSAGCVLANRLSENPEWNVLLLEAGGEEPEVTDIPALVPLIYDTTIDWNYVPQKQQRSCGSNPCRYPRGKVMGGSSVTNAMIYSRGFPRDYEQWANAGNEGWNYESVLPYFKKSENNLDPVYYDDVKYHARGGYLSVSKFKYQDKNVNILETTFRELGYKEVDLNTENVMGFMTVQATQQNGKRVSTNKAFLNPIRNNRKNLKIITGVRVIKVLVDQDGPSAYGIEYVLENNRSVKGSIFVKKEVILSAGVFNTPQILMLSGIGPNETLSSLGISTIKDLKVGYNLQDQPMAPGVFISLEKNSQMNPNNLNLIKDAINYYAGDRIKSPWSALATVHTQIAIRTKYANDNYPDLQLYFVPELSCVQNESPLCYYNRINYQTLILKPKSRGRVTINTTDPFAQVLIYPNYFQNPDDINVYLESYQFSEKLKSSTTFKEAGFFVNTTFQPSRKDFETGNNALWKEMTGSFSFSICNPSCTCKMGPATDPEAVVDPKLNVHGIANLRVVDASVMPNITSGPLNAVVIMIAEKASDIIKNYWKKSKNL